MAALRLVVDNTQAWKSEVRQRVQDWQKEKERNRFVDALVPFFAYIGTMSLLWWIQ